MTSTLAQTPFTAGLYLVGAVLLAAGLLLLVSRLRPAPVWQHLRVWITGPGVDRVLRTAGFGLPGAGLVVLVGADPDLVLAGRDVALAAVLLAGLAGAAWATYAAAYSLTVRRLSKLPARCPRNPGGTVVRRAGRDQTPRAAAGNPAARGPVASPAAVGGHETGDATVMLPAAPWPPRVRGGSRAGQARTPLGLAGPQTVRLTGAPRRTQAAVPSKRAGAAAHQTPTPGRATHADARHRAAGGPVGHRPDGDAAAVGHLRPRAPSPGWDQTVTLLPVTRQQTETLTRIGDVA